MWRTLRMHKTFTLLNVGGWALGMAACIVMLLFVWHERGFDRFHSRAGRIYRLGEVQRFEGTGEQRVALSMYPMAEKLRSDYGEVETTVRLSAERDQPVRLGGQLSTLGEFLQVDSTFFQVFDFPVVQGDKARALRDPSSVVLTQSAARRLFGPAEAVGKVLEIYRVKEFRPFTVSAVVADPPGQSHLQFEALIPMHELEGQLEDWMTTWDANWLITYVLMRENAPAGRVGADLPNFLQRYLPDQAKNYELFLQPLTDIHLGSTQITHDKANYQKFDHQTVRLFGWMAVFILLIACVNFINLTTARATRRAREVGVRKVLGAGRAQLVGQFVGEAVLLALGALAVALVGVYISLPWVNRLTQRDLSLDLLAQPWLLPALLVLTVGVGTLSGLYPAVLAAAFKPAAVLKGLLPVRAGRFSFRNSLVVLQFTGAIGLIAGSGLINSQLNHMRRQNVGFDRAQVVVVPMSPSANKNYAVLRDQFLKNPYVHELTASSQRLGNNIHQMGARFKGQGAEKHYAMSHLSVDYNFLDFYRIRLLNGRSFTREDVGNKDRAYLVNEAFAREAGMSDPVGQPFKSAWKKDFGQIVGLVSDFNFNSLHHKVAPLYVSIQDQGFQEMSIRIDGAHAPEALAYLQTQWSALVTDAPFQATFLDEHFESLYRADHQLGLVVRLGMFLSILIACMGLFGLAMFVVEVRTREIGIRKVLGASVAQVVALLSRDFLKLVLLAALLAAPLTWYVLHRWLQSYAYRIELQWWMFALAGGLALLVAFVTVSFESVKAALVNPVKTLKNE